MWEVGQSRLWGVKQRSRIFLEDFGRLWESEMMSSHPCSLKFNSIQFPYANSTLCAKCWELEGQRGVRPSLCSPEAQKTDV